MAAGTGVETLALTTVNAAGAVTGSEVITVKSDGTEEKTTKDTSGNTLSAVETSEGNDGTVRVSTTQDGIETETFIFVSGESVTFTTNTSDGSVVVMEQVLSGGRLVEQQLGTGTQTSSGDVTTLIMDLGNGETATIVSNDVTGIEESTFQTNGVTTQFVREETDDSGNDIILSQTYSGGVVSDTTERVISVDNTVQDKVTSATGDITLTESGVDGSGKAFSKVLGTGKSEVVGGVTVDTITLSDNSTVVEKFDAAGEMTEKSVADQGGDAKISTFNGGVETIAYADIDGLAIDKSEVDIKVDIGFANADLGFQNVDYADMAGGFTSQAGDFDMSIDYSNTELATSDGGYGGASSAASGDAATTNTLGYNGTNNSTNNNNGPAEDLTAFSDYFSDSLNDTPPIPDFY